VRMGAIAGLRVRDGPARSALRRKGHRFGQESAAKPER
jgi:hypothetical protein